jgi:putative phosphoesterase
MKILCIADLHQYDTIADRITKLVKKEKIDLVINAGDFFSDETAQKFLDQMTVTTFAVHGNWDSELKSKNKNVKILSNEIEEFGGYYFLGLDERLLKDDVIKRFQSLPAEKIIIIAHYPPYGILDLIWAGYNIGQIEYREMIEAKMPKMYVCGHIHESAGHVKYRDGLILNASFPLTRLVYIVDLPSLKVKEVKI